MSMRKILIPVAAGLLFSPVLMAADIDTNSATSTFADEFLGTASAASVVTGGDLIVVLGAEYAAADVMTLAFSGAALDITTLSTAITVPAGVTTTGITVGLLDSNTGSAVYRVTAILAPTDGLTAATTVDMLLPFADAVVRTDGFLDFDAQDVDVANGVTVSYSAATSTGSALDTGGGDLRSTDLIKTKAQFAATVTDDFDAVIDVEANREVFVGPTTLDVLEITSTLATGIVAGGAAALVDADYTITGDYSWIIDDNLTLADIQPIGGVVAVSGPGVCSTPVVTATTISYTCVSTTVGISTLTLDSVLNVDALGDLAVLPAQKYTATLDANFTGFGTTAGTKALLSAADAGEWALNGYQAFIPYMPYGSGIGQVIYLANRGVKEGSITVDWIDLNGDSGTLNIGTLLAGRTMSIGPLINAALPTAQKTSGRLALTVTANVPAADVQMNSQYNVTGNRAFTLHEDNRNP